MKRPIPVRVIPRPPKICTASRAVSCAVCVPYIFSRAIGPARCFACSLYDYIAYLENNASVFELKRTHHVVHLVCNIFQPTLHRLHASDHGSNLTADNSLRCQGLSKCLALVDPFKTFLYNRTLTTGRRGHHHPTFVVKIACKIQSISQSRVYLDSSGIYLSITKIPPPSGPRVFSTGTFALSNVTYAVPAAEE